MSVHSPSDSDELSEPRCPKPGWGAKNFRSRLIFPLFLVFPLFLGMLIFLTVKIEMYIFPFNSHHLTNKKPREQSSSRWPGHIACQVLFRSMKVYIRYSACNALCSWKGLAFCMFLSPISYAHFLAHQSNTWLVRGIAPKPSDASPVHRWNNQDILIFHTYI